ncbi:MAG: GHKL domain-containing protein [Eubacterium sp.]|nr:GHKL domain-containing protein [Eubacterium sp.]
MDLFLDIISSTIDAFLLTAYFRTVLGQFKKDRLFLYIASLLSVELILYINQTYLTSLSQIAASRPFTIALSVLTTFLISLFFGSKMVSRILFAIVFQFLYSFSESSFTWIIMQIQPDILTIDNKQMLYAIMCFGTATFMFLLILILKILLPHNDTRPIRFRLLLLITPILSLLISLFVNVHSFFVSGQGTIYILFNVFLCLINIINYIEIEWSARFLSDRERIKQKDQQIRYQKEKYEQLSNTYRQSRRFLHDTRLHFFTMQEYIREGKIDELSDYIEHSFGELEKLYARYNTGNLVIDSFLTSYAAMSAQYNIRFDTNLHVDKDRIPMTDYDLCIVLGNILDNAIKACLLAPTKDRYIRVCIDTTENDFFLIREENSMDTQTRNTAVSNDLEHGFGLENIERTTTKYHGIMNYHAEKIFHIFVRIPITDPKQRINQPVIPPLHTSPE